MEPEHEAVQNEPMRYSTVSLRCFNELGDIVVSSSDIHNLRYCPVCGEKLERLEVETWP